MKLRTLHIFSYGEIQLITEFNNVKKDLTLINGINELVNSIYEKKEVDTICSNIYNSISFFHDDFIQFSDIDGKMFRVNYSDVNSLLIDNIVDQL